MASELPEKKEAILRAGQQAIDRYGYQKTTLDDIAQICGIGKTLIYYYFNSKEALFNEIFTLSGEKFVEMFNGHIARAPGPEEAVLSYIDCRKEFSMDSRILEDVAIQTFMEVKPIAMEQVQHLREECIRLMQEQLQKGIGQGIFKKDCNTAAVAESIELISRSVELDELHNTGVHQFMEADHEVIADKSRQIVHLVLDGIRT